MIEKPLSQLKAFFKKAEEVKLVGSDQLMYLHLWKAFNEAHFPEKLMVRDADLSEAMRLYVGAGAPMTANSASGAELLRRCRQRLKGRGLIDFTSIKGIGIEYELIKLYEVQEPPSELAEEVMHAWIQANGENPYGGYLEDLITRQKRYGAKAVADAINRCRKKRTFGELISMNFLDAELLRGGEKNGKIVPISAKSKSTVEDWERERADTFFDD